MSVYAWIKPLILQIFWEESRSERKWRDLCLTAFIFFFMLILYNTVFTYYSSKDQLKILMPKGRKEERRKRMKGEMGRYSE